MNIAARMANMLVATHDYELRVDGIKEYSPYFKHLIESPVDKDTVLRIAIYVDNSVLIASNDGELMTLESDELPDDLLDVIKVVELQQNMRQQ